MRDELKMDADGNVASVMTQDVQPIVESARFRRDEAPMMGARYQGLHTLVARVPEIIVQRIKNQYGVDFFKKEDKARFLAIVRRDYPHLMTVPGDPFGRAAK